MNLFYYVQCIVVDYTGNKAVYDFVN